LTSLWIFINLHKSSQLVLLMALAALLRVPQALEQPSNHTSTLDTRQ